jgi:methionine-rich copper-binding protein CopC
MIDRCSTWMRVAAATAFTAIAAVCAGGAASEPPPVDTAPSVTSTSPADGADHVAVNTNIVVNFSEPVNASSSSFTLECPTGTPKSFSVSGSGTSSITLDPISDLPQGTVCTVTVLANGISDVDTVDPPDNMAADYTFSFTTDSAPSVTSTSPANGALGVAANSNITLTFSEPVTVDTSSFTISCGGNPQTFTVSGSGTASITLDPDSDLPSGSCTVTAVAANTSDVDTGDPPDHPAANYSFSFGVAGQVAARLRSLRASRVAAGVRLTWRTAFATDVVAFNVYRASARRRVRVNARPIVARLTPGARYAYVDRSPPRRSVRYWLQVLRTDGSRTWCGPVQAAPVRRTAY